ncbi:ankyrin repeat-containing protein [Fusarium tjaetaba]|uniref:Ankyrin repeat-containing protein n=1 Tax=Fusarium tjaetaba TaxID=1567544 RepID=A0A8H5QSF5_9HYPO|nr:ankyrin repeat-containing protein [Fusarium tjaetaba]KAF5622090.1 ankyrin repeat-containing protein [Fusarium tjaetaba]
MSSGSVSQWLTEAENSSRLTETDYSAQLMEYAKKRHPGTLNNLFESTEYNKWLRSSPQSLLLYSQPGAGKSVAVACLIQDLFRPFGRGEPDDNSIKHDSQKVGSIAYIFFDSLRRDEQGYDNIAVCIAKQLASSRLPSEKPNVPPWKEEENEYFLRPTELAVSRYLKQQIVCHAKQSTVFIILEGLDECPETSRVPLLALLAAIQGEYGGLNVLLTWRKNWAPACDIGLMLQNTRTLEICPSQQEMELYLTDNLPLELESRKSIIDKTIAVVNGRYLFAKLYVELIQWTAPPHQLDLMSPASIRPATYDELCRSIMDKISSQSTHQAQLAKLCLPWLTFAKRPLSVLKLQDALTVPIEGNADSNFDDCPIDITAIITSCGGLTRLDSINGTLCIRLYDRTIQDYFHRHLSDAEGDVGKACIKYLINRSLDGACRTNKELVERLRSNPFYEYAASHWGQHIQYVKGPPLSDMTIREFFSSRTKWEGVLQTELSVAEIRREGPKEFCEYGRLYYPAGNSEILEILLSHIASDIDRRDYQGRTPISHAADNGHAFAVSRLLEHHANPNLRDCDGCFPLWYAVKFGHTNAVRVLLDCKDLCGLNWSPYEYARYRTKATPLVCALKNGFRDIAEMLAEVDDFDPHAPAGLSGLTVLGFTIETGHEDIALRLLAKYGISSKSDQQEPGAELLVAAALIGSTELVNALLEKHRVNPNGTHPCRPGSEFESFPGSELESIPDSKFDGLTPLIAEAKNGHDIIVKLLLRHKSIRPDMLKDGTTALSEAARHGNVGVVNMLLADGRIDVNQQVGYKSTPLSLAASRGHEAVVEALLAQKETDPNCKDSSGMSTISRMLAQESIEQDDMTQMCNAASRILADPRFDRKARDDWNHTVLYCVAKLGATSLVELILEDPRADMGFEDDVAPLASAAQSGHVDVVEAFLKTGRFEINTPFKYWYGSSNIPLLSIAAKAGEVRVVDMLLSQPGIDVQQTDNQGQTPLAIAASRAATAIVERLLAVEGVDPNARDTKGQTPLHMAVECSNSLGTVEALLRAEYIRPDTANDQGRTPLSVLCGSPDNITLKAVNLLLATNAVNPDSRDLTGRGPLSWVIDQSGYLRHYDGVTTRKKVMQRLLQFPEVDPNAEDSEGLTPLFRAIQGSNGNEFVRVLLEREDLDVQQMNRDGLTPLFVATEIGDVGVMSLLRKRGAQYDDRDTHSHVTESEYLSAGGALDMKNLKLPSEAGELADFHAETQEESSSNLSSYYSSPKWRRRRDPVGDELSRDIILPLNEQKEHLIAEAANDEDLCARCATIDLDDAFSRRNTDPQGRVIARLGRIDRTWKIGQCPMCRLISMMTSGWKENWKINLEEREDEFALVALSSTELWLCQNLRDLWKHFISEWTDTVLLTVLPASIPGTTDDWEKLKAQSFILSAGFIGRVGSNCENNTRAITVTRVNDRVDYAAARGWIACCRETHSERCNHQRLARVPHFRVIDCQTRRVVLQGEEVDPYVALSYVWGPPPAASLKETSGRESCGREADRDGFELGQSVEAIVEDAMTMTLELGYRYLWVDRYCVIQHGHGKIKQEQLQSMDSVYANAEVTLVATAAQASSSGLPGVSDRLPRVPQHSVRIKGHVLTVIPPEPNRQIESSAWMTRGWTYQEGLLSRRRIFFSETEMSFECGNLVAREALRIPPRVERLVSDLQSRIMSDLQSPLTRGPEDSLLVTSWIYGESVRISSDEGGTDLFGRLAEYTERKLSYQSDALNAMLGILQVYATHEPKPIYHVCGVPIFIYDSENKLGSLSATRDDGSDYARVALAGFVSGLCWRLQDPGMRRSEFPSWSWTGWDGQVASENAHRYRVSFDDGFDVDLSVVEEGGTSVVPWEKYYHQLRTAVRNESRSGFIFSQHHKLDITANTVKVQFYEKHDRWTNGLEWEGTAFMRTCLTCGLVEDFQPSQQKQHVDPWEGWLIAEIQPLSWPPCVQYSESIEATPISTARVFSHRPNVQTSFQNEAQRERDPYVYSDLPKGSCIRLLELSPGNRPEILSGRLFEVWWEQETCPPYSALSYTWADESGDTSNSNLIFLDKEQKVLRITGNCDRALRSLRHKTNSKLLWVDSICINQLSPSERSHQVGLMKTIYSKATTVHSYVGEAVWGADSTGIEALTLLNNLQVNGISGWLSPGKTSNVSILNKFFARSYFARLWIVQELLLAQSITIHCGEVSLEVTNESISQLYEQGVKVPSWVRFAGKTRSHTEQAPLDLRGLLAATSVCRVTDMRDKIFGLLGLVSDVQASELSPDYELMVRDVYIGVAAYLMQKSHCCDLIQHANPYWVEKWVGKDHKDCKNDYGIPSWVPLWDTDIPLQTSQDILIHIEELHRESLLGEKVNFDHCTIHSIEGWPHDKNSECERGVKCCKTVDSKSGFLTTRMETVLRLDSLFEIFTSVPWEFYEIEDGEYFTSFWDLEDGLQLAIRSLGLAWKCAISHKDVHLIRIEGCSTLFLAHQTSGSRNYRLITSCVAAIVCQTRESSPTEMLNPNDLHHYLQLKPLTVEMIHFISKWRNQVLELARSNPEDREDISPIEDQSCHYVSGDKPVTSHPSWRSWIPFVTLETREILEDNLELQKQLPNLVDFWHEAHVLHTSVRGWNKSAFQVSYQCIVLNESSRDKKRILKDLLEKSHALMVAFETITGNTPILQTLDPLRLLLDLLADPEVKWPRSQLFVDPRGLDDRLLVALDKDRVFLDQAFPLDLHVISSEYNSIKETIEWKQLLAGIIRGNTEVEDIIFI